MSGYFKNIFPVIICHPLSPPLSSWAGRNTPTEEAQSRPPTDLVQALTRPWRGLVQALIKSPTEYSDFLWIPQALAGLLRNRMSRVKQLHLPEFTSLGGMETKSSLKELEGSLCEEC